MQDSLSFFPDAFSTEPESESNAHVWLSLFRLVLFYRWWTWRGWVSHMHWFRLWFCRKGIGIKDSELSEIARSLPLHASTAKTVWTGSQCKILQE
jgi:hypothetical protein